MKRNLGTDAEVRQTQVKTVYLFPSHVYSHREAFCMLRKYRYKPHHTSIIFRKCNPNICIKHGLKMLIPLMCEYTRLHAVYKGNGPILSSKTHMKFQRKCLVTSLVPSRVKNIPVTQTNVMTLLKGKSVYTAEGKANEKQMHMERILSEMVCVVSLWARVSLARGERECI